jgi:predicted enzyme related to lactoylglutathione lyase
MIKKFAGASIWSEDLNNLLPFYRDVLGLKVVHESDGFVVLGDDTQSATLGLGTHSEVHGRNSDPARHMIGLECDNLIADWKRLKEAGVQFIEDPAEYGSDMSIATLKDPEGNLVQLWQYRGLSEQDLRG